MGVLPFENLTADSSLDWAGAAVAGIISQQAGASTRIVAVRVGSVREAMLNGAGRILRGYFDKRGDKLRFFGAIEDAATHRTLDTLEASGHPDGLGAIAEVFARKTGDRLRPFSTQNAGAIRAWGESLAATDFDTRAAALERAVAADPAFGAAYADFAQMAEGAGRKDLASQIVERARPRISNFNEVDRVRIQLVDAEMKSDAAGRRAALTALSKLVPTDAAPLTQLAAADLQRRDFASAAGFYQAALAIAPDRPDILNQAGYAEAYRGNLEGARAVLERARALQPDQLNFVDSLGETSFFLGRFEEAEKYFLEAQSPNPAFLGGLDLVKAAQCRLMRGDLAGADQLFARYLGPVDAAHPISAVRQAQWQFATGRRQQALDTVSKIAGPAAPVAAAQELIWRLQLEDRGRAAAAVARCTAGGNAGLSILCRAFTDPQAPVPDQLKDFVGIYRPLLARDFAAALPLLKRQYEQADPASDGGIRALYAWALLETGKTQEAAKLVELYPFFATKPDMLFASLEFPRFLAVRAAVRRQQGKTAEAGQLMDLYRRYSGETTAK